MKEAKPKRPIRVYLDLPGADVAELGLRQFFRSTLPGGAHHLQEILAVDVITIYPEDADLIITLGETEFIREMNSDKITRDRILGRLILLGSDWSFAQRGAELLKKMRNLLGMEPYQSSL